MDGLRSETKTGIMCKLAGLPLGFQVGNYAVRCGSRFAALHSFPKY